MKKVLLLKFGELFLKGKNKRDFERQLIANIKTKLIEFKHSLFVTPGRIVVADYDEQLEDNIISNLTCVFGLIAVSKAIEIETSEDAIVKYISEIKFAGTFRVNVKRADKKFPIQSTEFERQLGGVILENNKDAKVDLHNPDRHINVDIRLNGNTYVYYEIIKCVGGLPLGTAGKALLLLSGGIDSPVAGYMMAKRGLELEAVHFHSYPYTSEQAKNKVIELGEELCKYVDKLTLHVVSFTKIQEQIHFNCDEEYMITIMRRIMMRIAERICGQNDLGAIITGESLGQVASQTMQSINVTNSVVKLPVFRPLIGFDKEEIIAISKNIGTYDTSILPYEDCCTVFLPKYPVIKPTIKRAEFQEKFLDVDGLVEQALRDMEDITLTRKI